MRSSQKIDLFACTRELDTIKSKLSGTSEHGQSRCGSRCDHRLICVGFKSPCIGTMSTKWPTKHLLALRRFSRKLALKAGRTLSIRHRRQRHCMKMRITVSSIFVWTLVSVNPILWSEAITLCTFIIWRHHQLDSQLFGTNYTLFSTQKFWDIDQDFCVLDQRSLTVLKCITPTRNSQSLL